MSTAMFWSIYQIRMNIKFNANMHVYNYTCTHACTQILMYCLCVYIQGQVLTPDPLNVCCALIATEIT